MIKVKGDKKVETWNHHQSGITCDIYLRHTTFVATLLEESFSAPDISILRKKLTDKAEHWLTMEWFPLMEIHVDNESYSYRDDPEGASIGFKRKRYYVSMSPAGHVWSVGWEVDEKHRKAQMHKIYGDEDQGYGRGRGHGGALGKAFRTSGLPLGSPMSNGEDSWVMDYDDILWMKFEDIVAGIYTLRRRIRELVSTKQGLQQLLHGGATKLVAIKEKAEK